MLEITDDGRRETDNVAPSVTSIGVSGSPGSGDTSMAFTVNFSEAVGNISTDDFTLVATGSAAGSIASVSASSWTSVNVNIAGISGSGSLKLNLNAGTDIIDGVWTGWIDPMLLPERRERGDLTNSRIIIYAVRPYAWKDQFPKVNAVDPAYSAEIAQKWAGKLRFLSEGR